MPTMPPDSPPYPGIRHPRPLVFIDTETTGLDISDPIWEIALTRREVDGCERSYIWHLSGADRERLIMPTSMPEQFQVDFEKRYGVDAPITYKWSVAAALEQVLAGRPYLVGAVPSFDAARISHQLGVDGWHYYLIDVLNLATGWLAGRGYEYELPQKSDELSRVIGIDPADYYRHTAMGDVNWTKAIYDKVMHPVPVNPGENRELLADLVGAKTVPPGGGPAYRFLDSGQS